MIASAWSGPSATNSTCLTPASRTGAVTMPAPPARPESSAEAASSASSTLRAPESWRAASDPSIVRRSSSPTSPTSISPSTNRRRPACVGMRPAEVWGADSRPSCARSCMVLRIEAGDSDSPPLDTVREPTGSPVSR